MDAAIPQRLLIVSQPLQAGVPRHVLDLVQRLDPAAYEIAVACPRVSELWSSLEALRHVRRHEIAAQREPALVDGATWARIMRLVRGADLVHAHSSKAGFVTRLAAAVQGRASDCIFTPHGWSFWAARGATRRVYQRLERLAARWCRTIVTVSDCEQRDGLACRIGRPDQYRLIHNGVDVQRFATPPAPVRGRILMVGRLAAPKRPDLAVRAVAALRARFPDIALHLIGDGPEQAAVEALIARCGLQGAVRLLGRRADVPALLAEAQCVVLASDSEACPLSVIEAMAAGAPVVASRVGGVPELIDHGSTGLLVEPGALQPLTDALAGLLMDPERARTMGEAGRRKARQAFGADRMAREIVAVYREASADVPAHRTSRVTEANR